MRIAVTGANGDLGSNLVPYLASQGHTIVSIDRSLPVLQKPFSTTQHYVVDVRNFGEVIASFEGCDAVIHLAAHRSPLNMPPPVVYAENTAGSFNVLFAAATLGIRRVCMASSINAIGGAFSRAPRYNFFPLNEHHPSYAEDPYSLSKWVLEQQGEAIARRYPNLTIASLRFHWLLATRDSAVDLTKEYSELAVRHLWAYTLMREACRACLLAVTADFRGHENFYIVAPQTCTSEETAALCRKHYPHTEFHKELSGYDGLFDCTKAALTLGWHHED